ncbi:MAG: Gfo/Idh/MocA family oxidoreductase [Chloroflexi bacterium]|nr:Gfo/Idh/MocA family oxidoreductase [Chloroflexota bacterium]
MDGRVRIGVIGTGFGKQHIRAFGAHPRAVVAAVCSTDAARAAQVAAEFGVPRAYGDYRALLAEAPVDAVAIVTPPGEHAPMALAALEARKHVLCAKPLATSLADAEVVLRRARASGLVHAIDLQQRFAPAMLYTEELLDGGAIGRPLSLVNSFGIYLPDYFANPTASPNKRAWFASRARSGGIFLANAPHELDRLLWLFGPVGSVSGHAHTALPAVVLEDGTRYACDADDSYHAVLRFASGLVGLVQCTPIAWRGRLQRLEVHGDAGSLVVEAGGGDRIVKRAGPGDRVYQELPVPERLAVRPPAPGVSGPVYALADRFVRAILDGEPMAPSFEDGFRVQELIDAIVRSDQTGVRQDLGSADAVRRRS